MFLSALPVVFASILGAITDVAILEHRFEPDSVRVQPGDTVRWTHRDATAHTVTGQGGEAWSSEHMAYGDVYIRAFPAAGAFDYVCLYHPMFARVFVGNATAIQPVPGAKPAAPAHAPGTDHGAHEPQKRDARGRTVKPEQAPSTASPVFTPPR